MFGQGPPKSSPFSEVNSGRRPQPRYGQGPPASSPFADLAAGLPELPKATASQQDGIETLDALAMSSLQQLTNYSQQPFHMATLSGLTSLTNLGGLGSNSFSQAHPMLQPFQSLSNLSPAALDPTGSAASPPAAHGAAPPSPGLPKLPSAADQLNDEISKFLNTTLQRPPSGGRKRSASLSVPPTAFDFGTALTAGPPESVLSLHRSEGDAPAAEQAHAAACRIQRAVRRWLAATEQARVDKQKKQRLWHEHRTRVVMELFSTETTYVSALDTMIKVFLRPLRQRFGGQSDSSGVTHDMVEGIFGNIEKIVEKHTFFLMFLGDVIATWSESAGLASGFIEMSNWLDVYIPYCNNFDNSHTALARCSKFAPFRAAVKDMEKDPACKRNDLASFLIMPIQRIPRYELLLKEIRKYTWANHPDCQALDLAIGRIKKAADAVNRAKKFHENKETILAVQALATPFLPHSSLKGPLPQFLSEGEAMVYVYGDLGQAGTPGGSHGGNAGNFLASHSVGMALADVGSPTTPGGGGIPTAGPAPGVTYFTSPLYPPGAAATYLYLFADALCVTKKAAAGKKWTKGGPPFQMARAFPLDQARLLAPRQVALRMEALPRLRPDTESAAASPVSAASLSPGPAGSPAGPAGRRLSIMSIMSGSAPPGSPASPASAHSVASTGSKEDDRRHHMMLLSQGTILHVSLPTREAGLKWVADVEEALAKVNGPAGVYAQDDDDLFAVPTMVQLPSSALPGDITELLAMADVSALPLGVTSLRKKAPSAYPAARADDLSGSSGGTRTATDPGLGRSNSNASARTDSAAPSASGGDSQGGSPVGIAAMAAMLSQQGGGNLTIKEGRSRRRSAIDWFLRADGKDGGGAGVPGIVNPQAGSPSGPAMGPPAVDDGNRTHGRSGSSSGRRPSIIDFAGGGRWFGKKE